MVRDMLVGMGLTVTAVIVWSTVFTNMTTGQVIWLIVGVIVIGLLPIGLLRHPFRRIREYIRREVDAGTRIYRRFIAPTGVVVILVLVIIIPVLIALFLRREANMHPGEIVGLMTLVAFCFFVWPVGGLLPRPLRKAKLAIQKSAFFGPLLLTLFVVWLVLWEKYEDHSNRSSNPYEDQGYRDPRH